jgi:hypothetical protein
MKKLTSGANIAAVGKNVKIYLSATAGSIQSGGATGKVIMNAKSVTSANSASTTVKVLIERPFAAPQNAF